MLAGDAAQRVSRHVEVAIAAQGKTSESKGTVVIGTVMGISTISARTSW